MYSLYFIHNVKPYVFKLEIKPYSTQRLCLLYYIIDRRLLYITTKTRLVLLSGIVQNSHHCTEALFESKEDFSKYP